MVRYVIFDTETTGLDPLSGDKIIEIGCVEMIDGRLTENFFHTYINPEKHIPEDVVKITHITDEKVANSPIFKDIATKLMDFFNKNTEKTDKTILVAHNASFDIKFLNHELKLIDMDNLDRFEVIDTLDLARKRFPNQKATLDILCEKFNISLEERQKEGHGALTDSKILAKVFLELIKTVNILKKEELDYQPIQKRPEKLSPRTIYTITQQEQDEHINFLTKNGIPVF